MKRFLFLLTFLICVTNISATYHGIKQASETIKIQLNEPLDSLYGIPRVPDSFHVITMTDNGTNLAYSNRSTTYPFAVGVDTVKHYGDTIYYFEDQIQDIDGTAGNFMLSITCAFWYDDIPTYTFATVQVIADSLNEFSKLKEIYGTTVTATLQSLIVSNSSGTAVQFTSTGSNGYGFIATGNGGGEGAWFKGGATGHGFLAEGGVTSGNGIYGLGIGTAAHGGQFSGALAGNGIYSVGGATGHGFNSLGGATSGDGAKFESQTGGYGLSVWGDANHGLYAVGDGAGDGFHALGGVTNGDGIQAVGQVSGSDIEADITGDLSGSVGSVIADVGIDAGSVDDVWDELLTGATHNINNSAGKLLRQIKGGSVIHDGTSDNVPANTANQISLETGGGSPTTSTVDNFYNHQRLTIVEGAGEGEIVLISDYNGTNQVATVTPSFFTTPDATSVYEILPGIVHAETQGGGYAGGAVWVSPNGTAGTQLYVNGTIDNPIDDGSFGDAKTVADALNITTFRIENGSNVTLATTYNNYSFEGTEWTLALGGQDLALSTFRGADVTGVATGANVIEFFDCHVGAIQLPVSEFFNCGFGHNLSATDSLLATGAGQYLFRKCYSLVSGTLTPVFSMGDAVGDTKFGFRGYDGGLELSEINSTGNDSISIEGMGSLVLNATDIGGELVIRGLWTIDSTAGGSAVNLTRDAALSGEYIAFTNWQEILTGSLPNNSSGKLLRDITTQTIRAALSQGMAGSSSNIVLLDASASLVQAYDPARILNVTTGESGLIIEYDSVAQAAVLFRDLKTPFNNGDEFIIFSDWGQTILNDGRVRGATSNTLMLNELASSVDSFYNYQTLLISAGGGADQSIKIKNYVGATKTCTLITPWFTVPDDSSSYVIIPDGDGFESRFMDSLLANPIPVVASDTTILGDTIAVYGTNIDARLQSLIVSNPSGDAVQFTSTGGAAGDAFQLTGFGNGAGLNVIGSGSQAGIAIQGGSDGVTILGQGNGDALWLRGGTTSGHGLYAEGRGTGEDFYLGGTGIIASANDTVMMRGDSLINQGAAGSDASPSGWDVTDSSIFKGLVDDTLKQAHTDSDWGATGAGGAGLYSVAVVAVDTVNTDTLPSVNVAIKTSTGADYSGTQTTESDGFTPDFSIDAGSYIALASRIGFFFPQKPFTISGLDTIYVACAPVNVSSPTDPTLIAVSGNITKVGGRVGTNLYGHMVTATRNDASGKNAVDTLGGNRLVLPEDGVAFTDSLGAFTIYLIPSDNYSDPAIGKYDIFLHYGGEPIRLMKNWYITGDVDIVDTLKVKGL